MKLGWKIVIALSIWAAVGVGALFEIVGLDPRFPWLHSISEYSYLHPWLFWLIFVLFIISGPILAAWWVRHRHPHDKIHRGWNGKMYVSKKSLDAIRQYQQDEALREDGKD